MNTVTLLIIIVMLLMMKMMMLMMMLMMMPTSCPRSPTLFPKSFVSYLFTNRAMLARILARLIKTNYCHLESGNFCPHCCPNHHSFSFQPEYGQLLPALLPESVKNHLLNPFQQRITISAFLKYTL
jgi:hypothetical protein